MRLRNPRRKAFRAEADREAESVPMPPERTLILPNRDLKLGHEDYAVFATRDLVLIGSLYQVRATRHKTRGLPAQ